MNRPNAAPDDESARSHQSATLGDELRARRESLGWSLADVAAWLRIRQSYLEALEAGRVRDLPGAAYAVGFLRSYAETLDMDVDRVVRRFRQDAQGELDRKQELVFPQPVSERGAPVGLWIGAGLAVIVLAYVGYYHFSGGQEIAPARPVPPVSDVMPGVTTKGSTSPQVASVMPDPGATPSPAPAPPSSRAPSSSAPSSSGATSGAAAGNAATESAQANASPPAMPAPAPSTAPFVSQPETPPPAQPPVSSPDSPVATPDAAPDAEAKEAGGIVLHASANAWISARDQSGAVVLNKVLKAGESWEAPASGAPYRITVGNAGGITLSSGGVTTPPLGRSGAVLRNLLVSAEAIRDGSVTGGASGVKPPSGKMAQPQLDQTDQPR
ncbi:helix-turn-helix domain-containing protein [Acidomonas methanolica]|uniref:HTH cro/C1-type domain-containing protein n=1 Tax=Acidomonas methanolica NBRC 104435 TaxID=1231351 RepID=A0A023D8H7_ACIMT|nr:helix-turn-helix domain-containing protein [Acidomonas methanolica]MBU2653212.1 helix-turn-helix domain-containing protein [Acidomonas methanolica]TCS32161.1 cytoskeleton protein RodZ [Acidomonas methanolica]GAJ30404.1 hypothetical protein Amme_133_004 [Acidomonas methanolica NBRC 104435]GBQ54848.1 hypothetical protein AA0498_2181 [Acidomonas methanolica]GEK97595.1 hypothetical protein AME01nite_00940 [Acidomonas methanolica NBRC 104435]